MTITDERDNVEFCLSKMLKDIRQACPEWKDVDVDVRNELIHKWRVSMLTDIAKRDATIAELRTAYANQTKTAEDLSATAREWGNEAERLGGEIASLRESLNAAKSEAAEYARENAELRKPLAVEVNPIVEHIRRKHAAWSDRELAAQPEDSMLLQRRDLLSAYDALAQNAARTIAGLTNDSLSYKLQRDQAQREVASFTSAIDAVSAEIRGLRAKADRYQMMHRVAEDKLNEYIVKTKDAEERERQLRGTLQRTVRGYVQLLEGGHDRIVMLGGTCDAVDVMERADIYLREARAALAQTQEQTNG